MSLRVLIVDDTSTYRTILSKVLSRITDVNVIGMAHDGENALKLINELSPDLITLDLEMPVMDGLSLLKKLKNNNIDIGVIVISSHTKKGSEKTIQALYLGAFHYITKPEDSNFSNNLITIQKMIEPIIKSFIQTKKPRENHFKKISNINKKIEIKKLAPRETIQKIKGFSPEIAAIGISTGGPLALNKLLVDFPEDFSIPILIVQHMPPLFTKTLANSLNDKCSLKVKEAEDLEEMQPGVAYIAPGNKQMKTIKLHGKTGKFIRVTDDPPENHCKPSVDYLFRSLSHNFPGKVLPVIMTGMGNDGTLGLRLLKRHKCISIVQDEKTSTVFGMPYEAINAGVADLILPLEEILKNILKIVGI